MGRWAYLLVRRRCRVACRSRELESFNWYMRMGEGVLFLLYASFYVQGNSLGTVEKKIYLVRHEYPRRSSFSSDRRADRLVLPTALRCPCLCSGLPAGLTSLSAALQKPRTLSFALPGIIRPMRPANDTYRTTAS
jgi:hypothetical protein